MRCFYHPDREAVGVCLNCHRGLCAESAADLDAGMACRDRCEETVIRMRSMVAAARPSNASVFPAAFGLIFTAIGIVFIVDSGGDHPVPYLFLVLGLLFCMAGVRSYVLMRRSLKSEQRPVSR